MKQREEEKDEETKETRETKEGAVFFFFLENKNGRSERRKETSKREGRELGDRKTGTREAEWGFCTR